MGIKLSLVGQVFGRLTVVSESKELKGKNVTWSCKCLCGNTVVVAGSPLVCGRTKSCGCLQKEQLAKTVSEKVKTHGLSKHPLHKVWSSMKERCYNPKVSHYKYYGGRGVKVCDRWKDSFENFYNDVIEGYNKGLQIDRIDNDGIYEPSNCRWVTQQQNRLNRGSVSGSSSKYKGVFWDKKAKKWRVVISKDGVKHRLGWFNDEDEAARVYDRAAQELFGEFAYLNIIKGEVR